jgi:hypothetical protein
LIVACSASIECLGHRILKIWVVVQVCRLQLFHADAEEADDLPRVGAALAGPGDGGVAQRVRDDVDGQLPVRTVAQLERGLSIARP